MLIFETNSILADVLWLYWSWFCFIGLLICVIISYFDLVVYWKYNKISSYIIMIIGTSMLSVMITWYIAIPIILVVDFLIFSGANSKSEIQKVYDQSIQGGISPREGKRKKQIQEFKRLSIQDQEKYLSTIPDILKMRLNSKVFYLVTAGIPILFALAIWFIVGY